MPVLRIDGYVIVSADGMLANAAHVMPDELKFDGDKQFFTAALDRAGRVKQQTVRLVVDGIDLGVHCVELLSSHSRQREADSYWHGHLPVVDGTTLEQIVLAQERGGDRTAQDLRKANQRDDISCCHIAVVQLAQVVRELVDAAELGVVVLDLTR